MTDYRDKQGRLIPAEAFENDATVRGTARLSPAQEKAFKDETAAIKAAVLKSRKGG